MIENYTTVAYQVYRIETAWGHAIEARILRGYSVVGQLALRVFKPWDGAIPFAEVDDPTGPDPVILATVVGVGFPTDDVWEYGIWVEGIALDHKVIPANIKSQSWLATRLIVDGLAVGGGSVAI